MNFSSKLPASVSTRRTRPAKDLLPEDEYNSDFDEFGSDRMSSLEGSTATPERKDEVKANKTRLGKIMSKAASTLGSIASLSPKKPESSPADRSSLSAASIRTRGARPESLPLSRHSEALPQRRPSSTRAAPASTAPSQKLPPQKPSSRSQSSDDDAQSTWREVEPAKGRLSNSDSDVDNSALVSPAVVAHSFSVRLPAGYANPDTVVPIAEVHSSSKASTTTTTTTTAAAAPARALPAAPTADVGRVRAASGAASAAVTEADVSAAPTPATLRPSSTRSRSSSGISSATAAAPASSATTTSTTTATATSTPAGTVAPRVQREVEEHTLDATGAVPSKVLSFVSDAAPVTALPVKVDAQPLAIIRYLRLLVRFSPEPLSSFFARLEPTVQRWANTLHFLLLSLYIFLEIVLELAIEVWTALKPYKPELLLPSFAGLVMCFFGGSFVTTIAAAEAYRLVGYDSTKECLITLWEEFQQVLQAAERDAAVGIDDVEPTMESSGSSKGIVDVGSEDPWSDWRLETETESRERRLSEAPQAPPRLFYSDGTESLSEVHHHAAVSAQTYHLEEVPPTPKARTAPVRTPVTTRSSARLSKAGEATPAGAGSNTTGTATTGKRLLRKRRSMFDAHSDGLDAFKQSVLEHRTPAKSRPSLLSTAQSSVTSDAAAGAAAAGGSGSAGESSVGSVTSTVSTTDSLGTETEQAAAATVPIPAQLAAPTPARSAPRRASTAQSLQEYQREQEELGADTTASKMLFFLQNVDPQRFTTAIVGLNAGLVAVVATLKVQFAKTITLGAALSKAIDAPAKTFLLPLVQLALPRPYKKWADVLLTYSIKSFAISIAWTLRRVVSSFHSAIRGGLMFSKNLLSYLVDMGVVREKDVGAYFPYVDTILGYGVALLGLWFQLSYGFALPFPLNVLLFPFTLVEYALVWMVNNSHYIIGHYA